MIERVFGITVLCYVCVLLRSRAAKFKVSKAKRTRDRVGTPLTDSSLLPIRIFSSITILVLKGPIKRPHSQMAKLSN